MKGTWVWSPVQEDPTCLRATEPMCYTYWAHILDPEALQSEKARTQQRRPSVAKNKLKKKDTNELIYKTEIDAQT